MWLFDRVSEASQFQDWPKYAFVRLSVCSGLRVASFNKFCQKLANEFFDLGRYLKFVVGRDFDWGEKGGICCSVGYLSTDFNL